MNPIAKNILAVVVGFFTGSLVNFGLITLGMSVIPLPEGADMSNMEAVRESMKMLGPAHFVFPFLGHALGTAVGAFVATKLAASNRVLCALLIGVLFLMGGLAMIVNCGGPVWFVIADLAFAYIPMALLGLSLAGGKNAASV